MIIEVLLFAAARELTGRDAVEVEVAPIQPDAEAAGSVCPPCKEEPADSKEARFVMVSCLRKALARQCPELEQLLPSCRFAVNCEYVGSDARVPPGAEVALIPPVSGG